MKDVVIHFDATFSLPPLCRGPDLSGGNKNAESFDDDKSQKTRVHNDSETYTLSDTVDIQSIALKSSPLAHQVCQCIRQSPISCRADIYFDTVVQDVYSISRDISLYSSDNNLLLVPGIGGDTGFGILISSCVLQHGEDPTAHFLPNPEPGYFEITKDSLRAYAKNHSQLITLKTSFDLNHVFSHEFDRVQRAMNKAEFDRPSVLPATDRQLIENNIIVYDRTLHVLFVFLGVMVVLFLDLYLHFQKQTSRNDAEWNGTPLVVLSNNLYTSGKVHLYFCVKTAYETSVTWKTKVVHWSFATAETIARCKQSVQNNLNLNICAVVAKISYTFDAMNVFVSELIMLFVMRTQNLWRALQTPISIRHWIARFRSFICRWTHVCKLKLHSNTHLIQMKWMFLSQSLWKKYYALKADTLMRLNSAATLIKTTSLLLFSCTKGVFFSFQALLYSKLGFQAQTEMTGMKCEVNANASNKAVKLADGKAEDNHLVSPICTYSTYPELIRTGLDELDIDSSKHKGEEDHSLCLVNLVVQERDRQLKIYENSLAPRSSEIDDKRECVHHSFEDSFDDSMGMMTSKSLGHNCIDTSGTDKETKEIIDEHSDSFNMNDIPLNVHDKFDQSVDGASMICDSSTRKTTELDSRRNATTSSHEVKYSMFESKKHLIRSNSETNVLDEPSIHRDKTVVEDAGTDENSLEIKLESITTIEGDNDDESTEKDGLSNNSKGLDCDRDIAGVDQGYDHNCSNTTVVTNAPISQNTVDARIENHIRGAIFSKTQDEKSGDSIDSSEKTDNIDQNMESKVELNKPAKYHDMNEELKEKLKLRFNAISSLEETVTNDENVLTVTSNEEALGGGSSLSGYSCIQRETTCSKTTTDISHSSLKMEIKNCLLEKDVENTLSPDRLNKTKNISNLIAKWGATTPSQIPSPEEAASSKNLRRPKKLNSPFLKHDMNFSKVKKITPVKENGASSQGQVTEKSLNMENPLSFLNNMLE